MTCHSADRVTSGSSSCAKFISQYQGMQCVELVKTVARGLSVHPVGVLPWDAIYPKGEDGLPRLTQGAHHAVRLFWMGEWRRVDVDLTIPLEKLTEGDASASADKQPEFIQLISHLVQVRLFRTVLVPRAQFTRRITPAPTHAHNTHTHTHTRTHTRDSPEHPFYITLTPTMMLPARYRASNINARYRSAKRRGLRLSAVQFSALPAAFFDTSSVDEMSSRT
jgi:hypothetical protein